MKYQEYKEQRQKEFNELPLFWAFSEEQLKEAIKERKARRTDVISIPAMNNALCLKKDKDTIIDYLRRPDELPELMKDPAFAEDAFYYEMGNHEYCINWQGDWDVCSCFGSCKWSEDKDYKDYLTEMGYSDIIIASYLKAKNRHMKDALDNEWI